MHREVVALRGDFEFARPVFQNLIEQVLVFEDDLRRLLSSVVVLGHVLALVQKSHVEIGGRVLGGGAVDDVVDALQVPRVLDFLGQFVVQLVVH